MIADRLTRRRERQESHFPDTISVLRKGSFTRTAGGGRTGTESEVATYAGRMTTRQVTPREAEEAGRPDAVGQFIAVVPWDADVKPTDILRSEKTGIRIDVAGTDAGESDALVLTVWGLKVE